MNIDNIRPAKPSGKFATNDELLALLHGKRVTRNRAATLLGIKRHCLDNWLQPVPATVAPHHHVKRLKEILTSVPTEG